MPTRSGSCASSRLDHAESRKLTRRQELHRDRDALALQRIVLDHDDGEAAAGALIGQRLQRLPQVVRPAKAGNADDNFDRSVERGRYRHQCALRHGVNAAHLWRFSRNQIHVSVCHRPEPGLLPWKSGHNRSDMTVRSGKVRRSKRYKRNVAISGPALRIIALKPFQG